MPQFFIDKSFSPGGEVEIRGQDARHISQVMRLKTNDWLVLSDGNGRSFRAEILTSSPRRVRAVITEEISRHAGTQAPRLALAVIKVDRFEWAIQKSVELGCRHIIPFTSQRTVPQYAGTGLKKRARWQKIAIEAAKQSGLPFRPKVEELQKFCEIVKDSKDFARTILFYEGERETCVRSLFREKFPSPSPPRGEEEDLLIIGPEGGFTDEEVHLARQYGIITCSLGQQILRVETAAISALTIWQYEAGDMDVGIANS